MIHLDQKTMVGTRLIYKNQTSKLTIALESLLPTRTHSATLVTPELNKGKAIPFTCVQN